MHGLWWEELKIAYDNITRSHEMLLNSDGVLATARKYNASCLHVLF